MIEMAAKKRQKKEYLPRKDQLTPKEIVAKIAAIETVLGEMRAYVQEMERDGFEDLTVDGVQKLPNATTTLREFALNLRHAIGRARLRQDF